MDKKDQTKKPTRLENGTKKRKENKKQKYAGKTKQVISMLYLKGKTLLYVLR